MTMLLSSMPTLSPRNSNNAVHCVFPYRHAQDRTTWVFDDARFGVSEEPFILGASEAIHRVVARKFPNADRLKVIFAATPIPSADVVLRRVWNGENAALHGCNYHDGVAEFWLCPAMMRYFAGAVAPEKIYVVLTESGD